MKDVVVTTDKRGVFAGRLIDRSGSTVRLKEARMCVYWSTETRGVLGLASHGPAPGSRITRAVPSIDLDGVTAVIEMTPAAVEQWKAEPWS